MPFLYLAFLRNQGNANNSNGSYGYGYSGGSATSSSYGHSSARIWFDFLAPIVGSSRSWRSAFLRSFVLSSQLTIIRLSAVSQSTVSLSFSQPSESRKLYRILRRYDLIHFSIQEWPESWRKWSWMASKNTEIHYYGKK